VLPDRGVEGDPVGGAFQQGHIDRRLGDGVPVAQSCRGHQVLLGLQDPGRGEQLGAGDGVDAGTVRATQQFGFDDVRLGSGQ
jgi:hypothetical protein